MCKITWKSQAFAMCQTRASRISAMCLSRVLRMKLFAGAFSATVSSQEYNFLVCLSMIRGQRSNKLYASHHVTIM